MIGTRLEDIYRALGDEHRALISLIHRVERETDPSTLTELLETLHRTLISHFSKEQFPGGLYESMGAHGDAHQATLKSLVEDHWQLLEQARGLVERAKSGEHPEALRRDIDLLTGHLLDHERREHELAELLLGTAPH